MIALSKEQTMKSRGLSALVPITILLLLLNGGCGDDSSPEGSGHDMDLVGFWDLTSWTWTVDGVTDSYTEADLDSIGIVWTLDLQENGDAEQVTNMSGPLTTMPGTWETSDGQMTLNLEGPTGEMGTITYDYVVAGDALTLDWSLPENNTFSAVFRKG